MDAPLATAGSMRRTVRPAFAAMLTLLLSGTVLRPLPVLADPALVPAPAAQADALPGAPARGEIDAALTGTLAAPPVPSASPAADIVLPAPPEAPVVIKTADLLGAAIEQRLGDPALALGARLSRKERESVAAFYALGGFKPLWIADGLWTEPAKTMASRMKAAGEEGLSAPDYPVPDLAAGADARALAEADIKLTADIVRYARDARGARIEPSRLSRLMTPKLDLPDADAVLVRVAAAGDKAGEALASYNPPQPGYRALRAKLAELRARKGAVPMVEAPAGKGRDGERTASLSAASPRLEGEIVANMERWRWLPADLGREHVFVNIPEYKVRVVADGRIVHEARVVVGKPETPTPIFSGTMEYAVVNPSWNVPPSILKNEFLPGLARDPAYAAKRGYEVVRRGNTVSVRQPPGERNALGFIKFMFPNQHAVYLHDTPSRALFASARRAFSHGCVRVDKPFDFAEVVLGAKWPEERLRKLIGKGERTVMLPEKIPVHLTYFTATVDDAGVLRTLDDIYGTDKRVEAALGLNGESLQAIRAADAAKAKAAAKEAAQREAAAAAPPRPKPRLAARPAAAPYPAREAAVPTPGFFDFLTRN